MVELTKHPLRRLHRICGTHQLKVITTIVDFDSQVFFNLFDVLVELAAEISQSMSVVRFEQELLNLRLIIQVWYGSPF